MDEKPSQSAYHIILWPALTWAGEQHQGAQLKRFVADKLTVILGCERLEQVPGLIAKEVDALLPFDIIAIVNKAQQFVGYVP